MGGSMGDSWIRVLVLFMLALIALAIVGLVAVIRFLSQPSSTKYATLPASAEELRKILQQHDKRLVRLEQKMGVAKSVPPSLEISSAPKTPAKTEPPKPKAPGKTLEEAVAGRWFQWIALAALLFGMGYFLKLAFENNWIGPMARVSMGWVAGIAFLALGHQWFKRYPVWAHSLAGGGLSFLYLSTYAAFQFYHFLDSDLAFALMILTTAAGSVMAAADKSRVLAAFTALGGFLTPILVSTGEDHQVVLMSYLLILNAGIFFLSLMGGWRFLRWGDRKSTRLN